MCASLNVCLLQGYLHMSCSICFNLVCCLFVWVVTILKEFAYFSWLIISFRGECMKNNSVTSYALVIILSNTVEHWEIPINAETSANILQQCTNRISDMNQQMWKFSKSIIQNEQSFNNRGHRKMWMFLLLTCMYLLQYLHFEIFGILVTLCFSITYPTRGSRESAFLKSNAYKIRWVNIKHTSMRPLASA